MSLLKKTYFVSLVCTDFSNLSIRAFLKRIFNRSVWIAIGLGQILSLLICGTAVTSGLLDRQQVHIPTAQSFLNYVLLCLVFSTWLACRCGRNNGFSSVKYSLCLLYLFVAVVDVEANYLIVKAYQYTTVTSVQLLDCIAIPTVLFLSRCMLGVKYRVAHFIGVAFCVVGVGTLLLADFLVQESTESGATDPPNKLLGDMLCLAGAVLYGVSNVCQEYLVCKRGSVEYLGALGLFGSIINGIQFVSLEREELLAINFTSVDTILPLFGFALCLFLLYVLMPVVISKIGAMAVNLNLLSSDFYALLLGLFVFHYKFHMLYFASFGVIFLGIIIYTVNPTSVADPCQDKSIVNSDQTTWLQFLSYQDCSVPADISVMPLGYGILPLQTQDTYVSLPLESHDCYKPLLLQSDIDQSANSAVTLQSSNAITMGSDETVNKEQVFCTHL